MTLTSFNNDVLLSLIKTSYIFFSVLTVRNIKMAK